MTKRITTLSFLVGVFALFAAPLFAQTQSLARRQPLTCPSTAQYLYYDKAAQVWKCSSDGVAGQQFIAPVFASSPTGDGVTQWVEVSLTNAEVLALRATPKQLVAAPGAGKVLELVGGVILFDYTAAYTESADNLAVKYENGSGVSASGDIEATGLVDATADTMSTFVGKKDSIVAKSGSENKALVLHNIGDGEYGGGNAANVIRVKLAYRVWTTGF